MLAELSLFLGTRLLVETPSSQPLSCLGSWRPDRSQRDLNRQRVAAMRAGRAASTAPKGQMKMTERLKSIVARKGRQVEEAHGDDASYVAQSQKHVKHVDEVLADCEEFTESLRKLLREAEQVNSGQKNKFVRLMQVSSAINRWRVKKKGSKLQTDFDALSARCTEVEQELKALIEESATDCSSLMLQAEHVQVRLCACIKHNDALAQDLEPSVIDNSAVLSQLLRERGDVASMRDFCTELLRMKDLQAYVPWGHRAAASQQVTPTKELSLKSFERRWKRLDAVVSIVEKGLQGEAIRLNKTKANLDHCGRSLNALRALTSKLTYYKSLADNSSEPTERELNDAGAETRGRNTSVASGAGSEGSCSSEHFTAESALSEVLASVPSTVTEVGLVEYDHSQCSDCSVAYEMANECAMHLAAAQHFASEGSLRLQKLCYARDQMGDLIRRLEEADPDGASATVVTL